MILFYRELTAEERLLVEHQVQQRPEMAKLLEESKVFTALLDEAPLLHADPPGDELLAYFVATRHVSDHPMPASLQEAFDRIEARLKTDAALRERHAEMVHRMAALEATTNPVQQFERLSGHRLASARIDVPAGATGEQAEGGALDAIDSASGRGPAQPRVSKRIAKWTVTVLIFGLAVYGMLSLVSHFSQSNLDRLAALDRAAIQDLQMRSTEMVLDNESSEALYNRALPLLREARTQTLGLFPHYRPATLRDAADLLERVVEQEDSTSSLYAEASYWLAKVRLAQKDVEGAKGALQSVLDGSGWKAREAQALLDDIEALSN